MNDVNEIPISILLFSIIIIVYSFYVTGAIRTLPCEKNFMSIISSNFVHIDYLHLLSNLYGIHGLSRVEKKIGTINFVLLLLSLLILNTIFELILYNLFSNQITCSIGFSGVLYGILMFELFYDNKLDYEILSSLTISIIIPSTVNKKISLSGHIIGLISGSLIGFICMKSNGLFVRKDRINTFRVPYV
jgi:membrane associated rhomboid family serine protease